jgi:hypothetical protein
MITIGYNPIKQITTVTCTLEFLDSKTEKIKETIDKIMEGATTGSFELLICRDKDELFKELIDESQ